MSKTLAPGAPGSFLVEAAQFGVPPEELDIRPPHQGESSHGTKVLAGAVALGLAAINAAPALATPNLDRDSARTATTGFKLTEYIKTLRTAAIGQHPGWEFLGPTDGDIAPIIANGGVSTAQDLVVKLSARPERKSGFVKASATLQSERQVVTVGEFRNPSDPNSADLTSVSLGRGVFTEGIATVRLLRRKGSTLTPISSPVRLHDANSVQTSPVIPLGNSTNGPADPYRRQNTVKLKSKHITPKLIRNGQEYLGLEIYCKMSSEYKAQLPPGDPAAKACNTVLERAVRVNFVRGNPRTTSFIPGRPTKQGDVLTSIHRSDNKPFTIR